MFANVCREGGQKFYKSRQESLTNFPEQSVNEVGKLVTYLLYKKKTKIVRTEFKNKIFGIKLVMACHIKFLATVWKEHKFEQCAKCLLFHTLLRDSIDCLT
jgi:hypothetical protein